MNAPKIGCSGSGIYSGRSGALQVFVSESPATKILIAKVPIDLPSSSQDQIVKRQNSSTKNVKTRAITPQTVGDISQDINLSKFSVKFLNFNDKVSQSGTVCNNNICCNYSVAVSDNGEVKGKVRLNKSITFRSNSATAFRILSLFSVIIFLRGVSVQWPAPLQWCKQRPDWPRCVQHNRLHRNEFTRVLWHRNTQAKTAQPI